MKRIRAVALLVCSALILTACNTEETPLNTVSKPTFSLEYTSISSTSENTSASSVISSSSFITSPSSQELPPTTGIEESAISETSTSTTSDLPEQVILPLCKSELLYCVESNKLLFSSNSDKIIAPASLTKLLTACVALRYANAETVFTVGSEQNLVNAGSSLCLIAEGHRLRLYDLIMGMLLASGNDAAYAVAANTARYAADTEMSDKEAVTFFCGLMNEFASDLGMTDSHFSNPDGWDAPDHYTTVNDLLKLTRYALSVPEIREIAATQQKYVVFASGENVTWTNSNRLLDPDSDYYCEYAVGMKTGTTENAGNCLIAAFEKNSKTYISIVVGCESNSERYNVTLNNFKEYT